MPRLDNTDDYVYLHFELIGDVENDPGEIEPVDLCHVCIVPWAGTGLIIDHPSYGEGDYHCFICKRPLKEYDDEH